MEKKELCPITYKCMVMEIPLFQFGTNMMRGTQLWNKIYIGDPHGQTN